MPSIILYQFDDCSFCARVRMKLQELGLEFEPVDVSRDWNDSFRKILEIESGFQSIPLLKIDDTFIAESSTIINYLEKEFG